MDRERLGRIWRAGQRGVPPSYPVAQFPNAPLAVALVASGLGHLTEGGTHHVALAVSRVGLAIWAYEELRGGDNAFRRVLGAAGLAYVIVQLAG